MPAWRITATLGSDLLDVGPSARAAPRRRRHGLRCPFSRVPARLLHTSGMARSRCSSMAVQQAPPAAPRAVVPAGRRASRGRRCPGSRRYSARQVKRHWPRASIGTCTPTVAAAAAVGAELASAVQATTVGAGAPPANGVERTLASPYAGQTGARRRPERGLEQVSMRERSMRWRGRLEQLRRRFWRAAGVDGARC